ncbi:unnamed protein product [Closterium sp. NIES-65]|nr:unnamed protein product [Closterium sp. NIES-65]CAI5987864.1 unnamed protein product [Closterium sp. NIES-65]
MCLCTKFLSSPRHAHPSLLPSEKPPAVPGQQEHAADRGRANLHLTCPCILKSPSRLLTPLPPPPHLSIPSSLPAGNHPLQPPAVPGQQEHAADRGRANLHLTCPCILKSPSRLLTPLPPPPHLSIPSSLPAGNHPLFQGSKNTLLTEAGRVDKFNQRYGALGTMSKIPVLDKGEIVIVKKSKAPAKKGGRR